MDQSFTVYGKTLILKANTVLLLVKLNCELCHTCLYFSLSKVPISPLFSFFFGSGPDLTEVHSTIKALNRFACIKTE